MDLVMFSPSPVPRCPMRRSVPGAKRSNMRSTNPGGTPGPRSETRTTTVESAMLTAISMGSPAREAPMALRMRLSTATRSRWASPRTSGSRPASPGSIRCSLTITLRWRANMSLCRSESTAVSFMDTSVSGRPERPSSKRAIARNVSTSDARRRVSSSTLPVKANNASGSACVARSTWASASIDAIGVLSSCDTFEMKCSCPRNALARRCSIAFTACPIRPISSSPVGSSCGSSRRVGETDSTSLVTFSIRRAARPATIQPATAAPMMPTLRPAIIIREITSVVRSASSSDEPKSSR